MIPLWAQIAGGLAAIASITSSSTQTARLVRVRTAAGISPSTWILLIITSITWFAYGISVRSPQQILANGSWVVLIVPLSWYMLHSKSLRTRLGAQALIALALLALLGLGIVNKNIPGWLGMPASLMMSIPQIRYTLKHGRGEGVSVFAWAFLATSSYLWFIFGIGAGEVPVFINSGIAAILGTIVVVALIVRPAAVHVEPVDQDESSTVDTSGDTEFVAGGIENVEVPLTPDGI